MECCCWRHYIYETIKRCTETPVHYDHLNTSIAVFLSSGEGNALDITAAVLVFSHVMCK